MTTAAENENAGQKPVNRSFSNRDAILHSLNLTLAEFAERVTVRYDDRWRFHDWRVQGGEEMHHWIYDHLLHDKENTPKLANATIIELAYRHFRAIQERGGQLNFNSVYVRDCEEVELIPHRNPVHATVRVVKDRIDGLYRFAACYYVGNEGSGSAPSYNSTALAASRTEAVLRGAKRIIKSVAATSAKQPQDAPTGSAVINKITKYIEHLEAEVRQPSLFG